MTDDRSVVLVTIDSMRSDYCGMADGDADVMPTLTGMAEDGLVFENAIAPAAATFASSTAFLTGMDAVDRQGANGRSREEMKDHVRGHMAARRSVAESFSDRGYETAAFTANPWTSRYFGYDDGFDHFEDFMDDASSDLLEGGGSDGTVGMLVRNAANWWQGQDMFMTWEGLIDEIEEWTATAEEPYFLWVFLVDPHLPYLPPSDYRTQTRLKTYPANLALLARRELPFESQLRPILTEAYENSLRYTDDFLVELQRMVGGDPLIAVHGDHGEMFGERGMYGHGRQLYDHLVDVPLVVANGPSERIEQPFSLRRLPALLDGLSRGEADAAEALAEPYVFSSTGMPNAAVRGRDWKYIWSAEDAQASDDEELLAIDAHREEPMENEALRSAGRDLIEWWRGAEAEKERIVAAADDLAASGEV